MNQYIKQLLAGTSWPHWDQYGHKSWERGFFCSLFLATQKSKCAFYENIKQQLVNTQRRCVTHLTNQIIQLISSNKIWFSKGKSDLMQSWEVFAIISNNLDTVPEPLVAWGWISWKRPHIPHLCHTFSTQMLPSASGHTMLDGMGQDHILTQHVQRYVNTWVTSAVCVPPLSALGQFTPVLMCVGTEAPPASQIDPDLPWVHSEVQGPDLCPQRLHPPCACHVNQTQPVPPNTAKITGILQDMKGDDSHAEEEEGIHKGWSTHTHTCCGQRKKSCSSRDVLEEPLTLSSLATQEVKAC